VKHLYAIEGSKGCRESNEFLVDPMYNNGRVETPADKPVILPKDCITIIDYAVAPHSNV